MYFVRGRLKNLGKNTVSTKATPKVNNYKI